jgi:hypothetical protein
MTTTSPFPERFPFSVQQAAEVTGRPVPEILDHVRSGAVTVLVRNTGNPGDSVWLPTEYVRAISQSPESYPREDMSQRAIRMAEVGRAVRAMLKERPPRPYVAASRRDHTGLVSKDRAGRIRVNVRAEDVAHFAVERDLHMICTYHSVVETTLREMGATRARGVRGLEDERQTWGSWWRLPSSMVEMFPEDRDTWLVDFVAKETAEAGD